MWLFRKTLPISHTIVVSIICSRAYIFEVWASRVNSSRVTIVRPFNRNPLFILYSSWSIPSVLSYRILYFRISPNLIGGIQFRDALRPIVREQIYLMNRNICYLFLMIMDSWRHEKRLSYKLRCYKRISSPVKSRNNTREKISYFFHVFDIANQLLTRLHLSRHSVRLMNER